MWETAGENLSTRGRNTTTNPMERAEPLQSKPSVSFRSRQDGGKYFSMKVLLQQLPGESEALSAPQLTYLELSGRW